MKKSRNTYRALLVALMAFSLVLLTGCSKNVPTTEKFKAFAGQENFIVVDAGDQFSSYDYIKEATIVAPQDKSYQVEFYVLSDSSYANSFFENNKLKFADSKSGTFSENTNTGKNYEIYTLSTETKYMLLERIDSTVIYVNTNIANKDTIDTFIKDFEKFKLDKNSKSSESTESVDSKETEESEVSSETEE